LAATLEHYSVVLPLAVYMVGLGFCLLSSEPILELKQEGGFIHEINNFCSSFLFFYRIGLH